MKALISVAPMDLIGRVSALSFTLSTLIYSWIRGKPLGASAHPSDLISFAKSR
jgi:hypothetical protein